LAKYADDGSIKPRFSIFDREIKLSVDREIEAMHIAYSNLCERMESSHITGEIFEEAVDQVLHPENLAKERAKLSMLERFPEVHSRWIP